jgi:hypothetical protein
MIRTSGLSRPKDVRAVSVVFAIHCEPSKHGVGSYRVCWRATISRIKNYLEQAIAIIELAFCHQNIEKEYGKNRLIEGLLASPL